MKTSPTQRTLAELRKLGCDADIVERWIPGPLCFTKPGGPRRGPFGFRKDLFGCFDIIAVEPGLTGVLLIQCSTEDKGRTDKIRAWEGLGRFLAAGNRAEFWHWAKRGARGKRKLWTLKREPVSCAILERPEASHS